MVSEVDDKIVHEIIESADFDHVVVDSFSNGNTGTELAAYHFFARSQMPAGTASKNEVSSSYTEIAEFKSENCTGCLKCISLCPDSAIKSKIVPKNDIEFFLENYDDGNTDISVLRNQFVNRKKFSSTVNGNQDGKLIIAIDPYKCKGCDVCKDNCTDGAFSLLKKNDVTTKTKREIFKFFETLPETEKIYIDTKDLLNISLSTDTSLFTGGANACAGCAEQTAVKILLNVSGYYQGKENIGVVNALSCSRNYTSSYPFNPFLIPCFNSDTDDAMSIAAGIRARWNQIGWTGKKLWILTNEGFWNSFIGFEEIISAYDIKILIINRDFKPDSSPKKALNRIENNKKVFYRNIKLNEPETFYKEIESANNFNGPAIIEIYTDCPEYSKANTNGTE